MLLLVLAAVFLILLVLVQRGRGGGLTGALGGMGGQSAFGTKAGDVFTKITIVTAAVWILLCIATDKVLTSTADRIDPGLGQDFQSAAPETIEPAAGSTEPAGAAPPGGSGEPAGEAGSSTAPATSPEQAAD